MDNPPTSPLRAAALALALALLVQRVGGVEALHGLGTDPLPAEPLVLDAVPEDLHEQLMEIDAALVDGLAEVHADQLPRPAPVLDEEFLTACRRFLVQAAVGDPDTLRGRANIGNTAAAIAWVVGRGNGLVGRSAPVRSGELTRAFELGEPGADLAKVMVAAQQSQVAFRATVEVRNRLVQAYQDVMNMPL